MTTSLPLGRRLAAWPPALGLAGLLAALAGHGAHAWRYFPMLVGDHGWYLQVALRLSRGETLYQDVAWAYGPLPAEALAALFRWLGPDAGWASALNIALTAAILLLTYALLRQLLRPSPALACTAFAALAGPFVGGDLIRGGLYAYTQAIAWGAALSLAAALAALRWLRSRRWGWLLLSAATAAAACLAKPEAAVLAVGACLAALAAGRDRRGAAGWLLAWGGILLAAAAAQASASGWGPLWRGYTGYDQLASGGVWGFPGAHASPRWLFSAAAAWAAALAALASRRQGRWRLPARAAAGLAAAAALAAITPDLFAVSGREALSLVRRAAWGELRFYPVVALQWLAAVPWSALSFVLLWAGWRGRRGGLPPAWWALWACALLANLRYTFTGYAAGPAVAPALAVCWRLWRATAPEPGRRSLLRGWQRAGASPNVRSFGAAQGDTGPATPAQDDAIAQYTPLCHAERVASAKPAAANNQRSSHAGFGASAKPPFGTAHENLAEHPERRAAARSRRMRSGLPRKAASFDFAGTPTPAPLRMLAIFRTSISPGTTACGSRVAGLALAALALINLLAQPFSAGLASNAPRAWLPSALGPVAVADYGSEQVAAVQAQLSGLAPADAPIFAPYWGAGWYLLAGRPNATPCDVAFGGLCATGPEAVRVQAALTDHPPAAVVMPAWVWRPELGTATQAGRAAAIRAGLAPWWDALARAYADATPAGVTEWTVLRREAGK